MKVTNPATGAVIRELAEDGPEDVARKHERARGAQPGWAALPYEERASAIRRFRDLVVRRRDELARTLTSEVGKPITQSGNELDATPGRIDFFLETTPSVLREETVMQREGMEESITLEPLGVVANVSAWNYPYFVGSNVFIPALLTGNTVLYKPSEFATLTGLAIGDLMREAGVPEDAFIVVTGSGETGAALVGQKVQAVFFTGSYATGRRIASEAGSRLIRLNLELGGKDPVYVADDVDVKTAAASVAEGAFYNTGQSCCAVERVYVHTQIHDRFLDAFVESVRGYVVGDPMDPHTFIGPLARPAQVAFLERQVENARAKGGRLLLGGKRIDVPGCWFEPTVVAEADHSMDLMRDESFGPLIGIQRVSDDEEAVGLMNDTPYGLTAGMYTPDRDRARRILSRVNSGSVYWNCCDRVSPRLPWTGRGHSGIGSTLGRDGIRAFVQPKAWHLRRPS
ncbi:MAG TPA: aldehyde dehydrogenase family protein [Vicinamibacteria bacterium]|nr:aldehyde dehydrogenase family protein [Vicinamibacteria bacterium]